MKKEVSNRLPTWAWILIISGIVILLFTILSIRRAEEEMRMRIAEEELRTVEEMRIAEEKAKIWNITLDLMEDAKLYSEKAYEFADSCNNYYHNGSFNYEEREYSMAEYHYSECQNQCRDAISKYGLAKAFFEEARTKLVEVETNPFTENILRLLDYWAETSGSAVNIYSNTFEACEYMEIAVVKYSKHDYESGDWAISKANTKINQRDSWVGTHNKYLAKSIALQGKIDMEVKYGKEE